MSVRHPRHLANEDARGESLAATHSDDAIARDKIGLDRVTLGNARRSAIAHGADGRRFESAVKAGVSAARRAMDLAKEPTALDIVGIAAWRAGALPLRDDALARAETLRQAGAGHVAAAILGLDEGDMEPFIEHQRTDRWWWPGRDASNGYVASMGGFVGLGGVWLQAPSDATALGDEGAFAVLTGSTWWRLDSDVWGTSLGALPKDPGEWADARVPEQGLSTITPLEPAAGLQLLATRSWGHGVSVSLLLPATTFLLWLHVESQ